MNLRVNEIFYSLQGEGGRTGHPSVFIRLSKCNLSCSFCDTEYESGVKMTLLMFKTQDEATSAQAFYSAANMKTHSDQKMLLMSDRDMGKDWFGNYQRGIFEQ